MYPFFSSAAILDNGCGVAQVLGRLIASYGNALPSDARLVAADLSPGMINAVNDRKYTETSINHSVWVRVETHVWDAQDLATAGVADESFSHVLAGLLLFMVERPKDVIDETMRVLKSNGGVFGMTSFKSAGWMDLIGNAFHAIKPGTRLPDIPAVWASTESIRAQLENAGFRDVSAEEVQTFYEFDDAEAMTRFNVENIPSVKMVTASMTSQEVEMAVQWMIDWLHDRFPEGKGHLEGTAIVAIARK